MCSTHYSVCSISPPIHLDAFDITLAPLIGLNASGLDFLAFMATWSGIRNNVFISLMCSLLQFYSWVVLFSLSLLFVLRPLSQGPFVMLTISISLSWDPSHSPYMPFNPYVISCITTGQGVFFVYLFLVMDNFSFSRFSRICCMLLLLILLSITFHDLLFLLSGTFYLVLSCSFAYSADLLSSI